jgi:hypothetical protein
VTEYLLLNSRPNDTIVVYPHYAEQPLKYYEQQFRPLTNDLHVISAQFYPVTAPGFRPAGIVWLLSCQQDSFLRSYRKDLSKALSHRQELRYDGPVLEQYSRQEPTSSSPK